MRILETANAIATNQNNPNPIQPENKYRSIGKMNSMRTSIFVDRVSFYHHSSYVYWPISPILTDKFDFS